MEYLLGNDLNIESSTGIINISVPNDFYSGQSKNLKMSINPALSNLRHDNMRYSDFFHILYFIVKTPVFTSFLND